MTYKSNKLDGVTLKTPHPRGGGWHQKSSFTRMDMVPIFTWIDSCHYIKRWSSTLCCWEAAVHTYDKLWKKMEVRWWWWWWIQQIRLPAICQAPCASTFGSKRRPWICKPSICCLLSHCTSPLFRGNWSQLRSNEQTENYSIWNIPRSQNTYSEMENKSRNEYEVRTESSSISEHIRSRSRIILKLACIATNYHNHLCSIN